MVFFLFLYLCLPSSLHIQESVYILTDQPTLWKYVSFTGKAETSANSYFPLQFAIILEF